MHGLIVLCIVYTDGKEGDIMCAIAGMVGLEYDAQLLKKMQATMIRRGPDDTGTFVSEDCALLHCRLAIIDPDGGAQPMALTWGNENFTIVYNGELYNTEDIRHELVLLGHEFQGHSDTEVILHAYAQWNEGILNKLNGIFADFRFRFLHSFPVWRTS